MPLKLIRGVLEQAGADNGDERMTREQAARLHGVPENVLERLEGLGVLDGEAYGAEDARIVEAIARFRAGGFDETLGFTVYDTLRYRRALEPLVRDEVRALLDRLVDVHDVERSLKMVAAGAEPLRELIGAMHSKLLLAELKRHGGRASSQ